MSTFYRVFKTERKWYSVLLIKVAQLCRIDGLVITPANNAFLSLSRMVVDTWWGFGSSMDLKSKINQTLTIGLISIHMLTCTPGAKIKSPC